MSCIFKTQGGGAGGEEGFFASIFVTGLSESDTVTASNGSKTKSGVWKSKIGKVETEIPVMSSNTTPSGVASSSSMSDGFPAYQAFTGLSSNGWKPGSDTLGNAYVQYEFANPIVPSKISVANIKSANDLTFTYKVIASADLQTWDTLIESIKTTAMGVFFDTEVSTTKSYKYFRLVILATSGANVYSGNGHKMQIYGTKQDTIYGHEISKIGDLGMWTVTATDGEQTATQDVLIDVAAEFEIKMSLSA